MHSVGLPGEVGGGEHGNPDRGFLRGGWRGHHQTREAQAERELGGAQQTLGPRSREIVVAHAFHHRNAPLLSHVPGARPNVGERGNETAGSD